MKRKIVFNFAGLAVKSATFHLQQQQQAVEEKVERKNRSRRCGQFRALTCRDVTCPQRSCTLTRKGKHQPVNITHPDYLDYQFLTADDGRKPEAVVVFSVCAVFCVFCDRNR